MAVGEYSAEEVNDLQGLRRALVQEWEAIPLAFFMNLIRSMRSRYNSVQDQRGGYTMYWLVMDSIVVTFRFGRQLDFASPVTTAAIESGAGDISPSGLASSRTHPGILYFVNGASVSVTTVFAVDASSGQIVGSIDINNATNDHWSAVAVGKCPLDVDTDSDCIYVHDAGDTATPAKVVYVVKEQADPRTDVSIAADKIISYTDQRGGLGNSDTIFVDGHRDIFFFDAVEGTSGRGAILYRIEIKSGVPTARGVQKLDLITTGTTGQNDASLSANGCELLVKTRDRIYYFPFRNGQIEAEHLSILPLFPRQGYNGIAWQGNQTGFYIVNGDDPADLQFSARGKGYRAKFNYGQVIGINQGVDGMAASRDHGGFIYVIRPGSSKIFIMQAVQFQEAGEIDLGMTFSNRQGISTGKCPVTQGSGNCVFVQNGGSNSGGPTNIIFVIPEPADPFSVMTVTLDASNVISYTYPGSGSDALMVDCNGDIYILDKGTAGGNAGVYKLDSDNAGVLIGRIPVQSSFAGPVGADISPCCDEVVVKLVENVLLYPIQGGTVASALAAEPLIQPYVQEFDGASVTFADDCKSYLTASDTSTGQLRRYRRVKCCDKKY
ncbi:uncharacterized protein LOC124291099 [Haliotis rubra]|uniref:uncharacterized protein LOC124291099 n=1 Tax=Haliotis rubra TaxID=36100 RepID=UPI001EE559A7|nr:uncharacterized protein LOC124291099 [Haliotis rubra]